MKYYFLIIGLVLLAGCAQSGDAGLANPSAVYCEEQGYTYDIRDTPAGSKGFCVFPEGWECGGWDYYNGVCTLETASACKDLCGDGECQEFVCMAIGCPCAETASSCPSDCV